MKRLMGTKKTAQRGKSYCASTKDRSDITSLLFLDTTLKNIHVLYKVFLTTKTPFPKHHAAPGMKPSFFAVTQITQCCLYQDVGP